MTLFPEPTNITDVVKFLQYVNTGTNVNDFGGMLGVAIVLILGSVAFMISKTFTAFENAMIYALFFSFFTSIMIYGMGIMTFKVLSAIVIIFLVALYFLIKQESKEQI